MKPILFNTEMARAILDGRKTVTRRVVKNVPKRNNLKPYETLAGYGLIAPNSRVFHLKPLCRPGDILYVRETWRIWKAHRYDADAHIEFKAGGEGTVLRFPHGCTDSVNRDDYDSFIGKWGVLSKWHPSIHMPCEAARLFLRVTNVSVAKLCDITAEQVLDEGVEVKFPEPKPGYVSLAYTEMRLKPAARKQFADLWNSTIKKTDLIIYGWDANPYVWVIEFERISREEALKC